MLTKILSLREYHNLYIIILLSIIFFFIYSYISFQFPEYFNSPDEAANYYFINHFIENFNFSFYEPLNSEFANLLHPRNSIVIENNIVPLGFLGFPLLIGFLGKLIDVSIILFIVPFFSSMAAIFFYLLLREIFSERIAILSSIILLFHPAFWYFSSISMHHNALFSSFFIISLYFFIKLLKNPAILRYYILFSVFIGLTITIRTNELVWLAILFFSLLAYYRKSINIKYLFISLFCLLFILTPFFYFNNATYSSLLSTGYSHKVDIDLDISSAENSSSRISKVVKIIAPSGIRPEKVLDSFVEYFIIIYPIFSIFVLSGIILAAKNRTKFNRKQRSYFNYLLILSSYLIIYYGGGYYFGASGLDTDFNISSSLIRYWLPIFIFSIPLISITIIKIIGQIQHNYLKMFSYSFITLLLITFSFNLVYNDRNFGLIKIANNAILYKQISNELQNSINKDAIIISNNADKFVFPQFKVIGTNLDLDNFFQNKDVIKTINEQANNFEIYYFTIFGLNDFDNMSARLRSRGIELIPDITIKDISSLYRITKAY